jgi:glycosyltransferase involved in cell wall biosynthesis
VVNFETLANVLDPFLESKPFVCQTAKKNKIRIINIGELHPKKDQKSLLNALALITSHRKDIELTIVGDGIEEINLKQLAKDLNIDSNVIFAGRESREQIYNHLIQSDILVLSSKYETFGVVIIEAMLFGKPVIVTRCGGPEGFVTSNSGYTINPENTEELIDAIQAAISNLDQFNAFEIREETIRKFGKDAFLKRISNVYEQIARKL